MFLFLVPVIALTICTRQGKDNRAEKAEPYTEKTRILDEPFRPQYHFSPDSMWMNDPNGLFYLDGIYHMFYQYHPYSTQWGPMHWGHAISNDLMHWEDLPIALFPDSLGTIFSGTAVLDRFNTSGFATGKEIPIVAAYSIHDSLNRQHQGIAFSNDKGMTWEKYSGNPVITNPGRADFRDPKVFWHEESKSWIMVLAVGNHVEFYRSPDLKNWTYVSGFGWKEGGHDGIWECPDLFRLRIPGSAASSKWVLLVSTSNGAPNGGSGIQYFIGSFNGSYFINDNSAETTRWLDYGTDIYAGASWSGIPQYDGRRIFIAWMNNTSYAGAIPTTTWRGSMTLPRKLTLFETATGLEVASVPVRETQKILGPEITIPVTEISGSLASPADLPDLSRSRITCSFALDSTLTASGFGLQFTSTEGDTLELGYQPKSRQIYLDRSACGDTSFSNKFTPIVKAESLPGWKDITFEVYTDRSSVECFINGGQRVLTCRIFPDGRLTGLNFFARDGQVHLKGAGFSEVARTIGTEQTEPEPEQKN